MFSHKLDPVLMKNIALVCQNSGEGMFLLASDDMAAVRVGGAVGMEWIPGAIIVRSGRPKI